MIRQETNYDCYATCMSIATGLARETIYNLVGHNGVIAGQEVGISYSEMSLAMLGEGIIHQAFAAALGYDSLEDREDVHYPNYPHHDDIIDRLREYDYEIILTLKRKENGRLHAIVLIDGSIWYDPYTGEEVVWDEFYVAYVEGVKVTGPRHSSYGG